MVLASGTLFVPELGNAVGTAIVVFGFVAAAVGAYLVLRSKLQRQTGDLWRQEAEALRARLATVEAENKECRATQRAQAAQIATLTNMVTGASAIEELTKLCDGRFGKVLEALEHLERGIR